MEKVSESLHFLDYWRVLRSRKEIIISVLLIVVLTAVGLTYTLPRTYEASTKIKIERQQTKRSLSHEVYLPYDPYFLPTQYEIIQSRKVIYDVIQNLDLINVFRDSLRLTPDDDPMQVMYRMISNSMDVQQYRDTKLIEIRIRLSEPENQAPELCANIANEIAKVFHKQRNRVTTAEVQHIVDTMEERWTEERRTLKESRPNFRTGSKNTASSSTTLAPSSRSTRSSHKPTVFSHPHSSRPSSNFR